MPKLHEILAVDRDAEKAVVAISTETKNTLTKKGEHFVGATKRLEMFDDDRKAEAEGLEEKRELVTTVGDKLRYDAESKIRHLDIQAQKEATNCLAKADIVIKDGEKEITIKENVPATLLLALEGKLTNWRDNILMEIPTLNMTIGWERSPDLGPGVWRNKEDEVRHRTEKKHFHKVMTEATQHQPAQIFQWTEDRPIGQWVTTRISGMITPAEKSRLLERCDKLIAAVKEARMRANMQEVENLTIGKEIFDYLYGSLEE